MPIYEKKGRPGKFRVVGWVNGKRHERVASSHGEAQDLDEIFRTQPEAVPRRVRGHRRFQIWSEVAPELASHFWPNVDMTGGPAACWPWQGHLDGHGYGEVRGLPRTAPCAPRCGAPHGVQAHAGPDRSWTRLPRLLRVPPLRQPALLQPLAPIPRDAGGEHPRCLGQGPPASAQQKRGRIRGYTCDRGRCEYVRSRKDWWTCGGSNPRPLECDVCAGRRHTSRPGRFARPEAPGAPSGTRNVAKPWPRTGLHRGRRAAIPSTLPRLGSRRQRLRRPSPARLAPRAFSSRASRSPTSTSSATATSSSHATVGEDSPRSTRKKWERVTPARSGTWESTTRRVFASDRIRLASRR